MTRVLVDNDNNVLLFGGKAITISLPTGYTEITGVGNTDASVRVSTGIYDDVDDVEYEIKVKPSLGSWYIFQSRGGTTGSEIAGVSGSSTGDTINGGVVYGGTTMVDMIRNTSHVYLIKFSHKNLVTSIICKDLMTGEVASNSITYSTYAASATQICLFGNYNSNYVQANNVIYYAKLKKNGKYVMDYVPAINSSNVVGFFDTISGTFKTADSGSLYAVN